MTADGSARLAEQRVRVQEAAREASEYLVGKLGSDWRRLTESRLKVARRAWLEKWG